MKDYVREYFDEHAAAWVESAYAGGTRFPIGPERVRLALEAAREATLGEPGSLVDLGCGGGQLLAQAARLGWRVVGVDAAPGMIDEAREATDALEVELIEAQYDANGLADASFDAVVALGLLEYLPADDGLFAEAARLLKPGGRFVVSCRNRLYNLVSANEYTMREFEGDAIGLLGELRGQLAQTDATELHELARELASAGPDLVEAARLDAAEPPPPLLDHARTFGEERRQHTPGELKNAAVRYGLEPVYALAVHPHPLPPGLERLSPRFYNRLALAWQRPLERSPLGLAFCTAFVAVFEPR
jgi:SAM-dependent methyltransferase